MTTAAYAAYPLAPHALPVLIATPNESLRRKLGDTLSRVTRVTEASTGAEALSLLERCGARIVVLDRSLPDLNCEELVGVVEQQYPGTNVVLLDSERGKVELPDDMRLCNAYPWFESFNQNAEPCRLQPPLTPAKPAFNPLPGMIGQSIAMQTLAKTVKVVARHSTSVLLMGETGAGKELAAEAVHALSTRADKPFITINCAAIPEALVEAELFGHTRGAFTGAVQARLGKIHSAHGGTLFFDEVGELPLANQSKLLRFLECGEVQRLGTSDVFRLDVRVIAATNLDLEERVEQGLFRKDLFYRLSIFPIELPPLRVRSGDIPLLAQHFLARFSNGCALPVLNAAAEEKLMAHRWPGNVRELRNVMERAFILADGSPTITTEHIVLRKCAADAGSETSH